MRLGRTLIIAFALSSCITSEGIAQSVSTVPAFNCLWSSDPSARRDPKSACSMVVPVNRVRSPWVQRRDSLVQSSTSTKTSGVKWGRFALGTAAIVAGGVGVLTAKQPTTSVYLPQYCGLTVCGSQEVRAPVEGLKEKQKILGWAGVAAGATVMVLSF